MLRSLGLAGLAACSGVGLGGLVVPAPGGAQSGVATGLDPVTARRLERATFGLTPDLARRVSEIGFPAWLDEQLAAPNSIEAPTGIAALVEETVPAVGDVLDADTGERLRLRAALTEGVALRFVTNAAFAPDQLRQRLVDAFADLLHVSSGDFGAALGLAAYDLALRTHALGRFADLLLASARSASMLLYLDNASSRADGDNVPNENYARELMELHTVGVDGGYDEHDVAEVAHALSGWTVDRRTAEFAFVARRHDLGPLASGGDVLGWRPDGPGAAAGESLLAHLARHPATARRVSHVLARRLVGEGVEPGDPLVTEAAGIYLDADTAIGPVVRHLLTSERFETSATLMVRRPTDLVATVLRRGRAGFDPARTTAIGLVVTGMLRVTGHLPYEWPAPDGAPFGSAAWTNAGAMITRWNALTTLAEASAVGLDLDWGGFDADGPAAAVEAMAGPDVQLY